MKTIPIVELKGFDGNPIKMGKENVTTKVILLQHLGMHESRDGKENLLAYKVGLKVADAKDVIELEDAEFELTKKTLVRDTPLMTAVVVGQVLKIMEDSNKEEK